MLWLAGRPNRGRLFFAQMRALPRAAYERAAVARRQDHGDVLSPSPIIPYPYPLPLPLPLYSCPYPYPYPYPYP
jgi:hypothetical protein